MRFGAACACVAVFMMSCSDTTPLTQTMVMVTGDADLTASATHVRVRVGGDESEVPIGFRDISAEADPIRVPIVPQEGDAAIRFAVTAELIRRGADESTDTVLATQTMESGFVEDELREAWLQFDTSCTTACPEGFRCDRGQCVEYCIAPASIGTTTRSEPVACGQPCATDGCFPIDGDPTVEAQVLHCENDYRVFDTACSLGCGDGGQVCAEFVPSNIGELVDPPQDLGDVVLDRTASFNTFTGDAIWSGGAQPVDGIRFMALDSGTTGCDGNRSLTYGVFFVKSLHITSGSVLQGSGTRPLIIAATENIVVDGRIDVGATARGFAIGPGPGGCAGGSTVDGFRDGSGLGAGTAGVEGTDSWSGGGGGSYAGLGGDGGNGTDGNSGGVAGQRYGNDLLVPLIGGSGGGAGGGTSSATGAMGRGGNGAGAIQLSAGGNIVIGTDARILASGWSAEGGAGLSSGGGGGSGGAILLEARQLVCNAESETRHIAAIGGAGGGFLGLQGASFFPESAPIPGNFPQFIGGFGSDVDGDVPDCGADPSGCGGDAAFAGGGGGGAGRVRVNTLGGDGSIVPCGEWLQPVTFGPIELR